MNERVADVPPRDADDRVRVVLVEDDPDARALVRTVVRRCPRCAIVAECTTASDALDSIVRHSPHAVILDLQLPGESGVAVLRAVRSRFEETAVVVHTAYAPLYSWQLGGADVVVEKGTGILDLPVAVLEAVERRRG